MGSEISEHVNSLKLRALFIIEVPLGVSFYYVFNWSMTPTLKIEELLF